MGNQYISRDELEPWPEHKHEMMIDDGAAVEDPLAPTNHSGPLTKVHLLVLSTNGVWQQRG